MQVCCAVEPLTEQQQAIKEGNSCVDEAVVAKPAEKGRQLLIPELPPYFFTQVRPYIYIMYDVTEARSRVRGESQGGGGHGASTRMEGCVLS